ncbi:uncharacterized protein LOC113464193 isoform X1 [Ceratina calcarata]|uniref:Uncharacterized protein LOC113464193 isoform X1 n=1 Tax=Ceratina calcarata TaxID=156304 RepID=A0AAJ7RZC2_9HYME|nr:uncharacterized protein LOC113464193 isoform X1 [Ceratina calcarata]
MYVINEEREVAQCHAAITQTSQQAACPTAWSMSTSDSVASRFRTISCNACSGYVSDYHIKRAERFPRNPLKTGPGLEIVTIGVKRSIESLVRHERERKMRPIACYTILLLCLAVSHAASTARLEKTLKNELEESLHGEDKSRAKKSTYTSSSGNLKLQSSSNLQGQSFSESEGFQTVNMQGGSPQLQTIVSQPVLQGGVQSYSLPSSIRTYKLRPGPQVYGFQSPAETISVQQPSKTVNMQSSIPLQVVNYQQPPQTVSIRKPTLSYGLQVPSQIISDQSVQQPLQILNAPSQQLQTVQSYSVQQSKPIQVLSVPTSQPAQTYNFQSSSQTFGVRPAVQRPIQVLSLPQKVQTETFSIQSQPQVQTLSFQSGSQPVSFQSGSQPVSFQSGSQPVSFQIPQVVQSSPIETLSIQQKPGQTFNIQSQPYETVSIQQSPSQLSETVKVIDTQPC